MIYTSDLRDRIFNLLESQSLAVLATQKDGQSYANLVAFAVSDNLQTMIFATSRSTRKFSNIQSNSLVALLADNRLNRPADLKDALAVTAIGKAMEANGAEKEKLSSMYLDKHPHMSDFISSPNQALIRVNVSKYIVVSNFQRVLEMNVDE
ncbi:MAG: pyridoxamine 5'-phosphate oxidase family protein [Methanotrichaceae archaeon]|nr:pyridoxamine 5'-phosphate oxidase family protein [Methanotrichaceae archaeon]